MTPIVIEDVTDSGTQWLLSFDGPNPSEDQCVRMPNREDAFKARDLVADAIASPRNAC